MDDLEEIRRRRLKELQEQRISEMDELRREQEAQEELEAKKRAIMRAILETDAKDRLARIKLAHPELAESIEAQLIMLAQSGRIRQKISDEMFVEILKKAMPKKRDIKITRK